MIPIYSIMRLCNNECVKVLKRGVRAGLESREREGGRENAISEWVITSVGRDSVTPELVSHYSI